MTRINIIPPELLTDQHLFAEFREIKMVSRALLRSLRSKESDEILNNIPRRFTLNKGHVKFFYNKGNYLKQRYSDIVFELIVRDYNFSLTTTKLTPEDVPQSFRDVHYADRLNTVFTNKDIELILERIFTRIKDKPNWYKYNHKPLDIDMYLDMIELEYDYLNVRQIYSR